MIIVVRTEKYSKCEGKLLLIFCNYPTLYIEISSLNNINPEPGLKFKGSVRHVQNANPTLVLKIDLILQN